jgi:hypothetical protein
LGVHSRKGACAIHGIRSTRHWSITLICRGGTKVCGQIDDEFAVNHEIVGRLFQIPRQHLYAERWSECMRHKISGRETTISAYVQINHVSNADIDDSEKSLVLLFELLLVKNLYGKYAVFSGSPKQVCQPPWCNT